MSHHLQGTLRLCQLLLQLLDLALGLGNLLVNVIHLCKAAGSAPQFAARGRVGGRPTAVAYGFGPPTASTLASTALAAMKARRRTGRPALACQVK